MSPRVRVLFLVLALVAAGICVRLGFWQRDRLHQRRTANAAQAAARELPPVVLNGATMAAGLSPAGTASSPAGQSPAGTVSSTAGQSPAVTANRRVIALGRYDHGRDMLIRNRAYQERPGVYVISPLLLAGSDTAVLVNRGFLPSPDGLTAPAVDSLLEPGDQRVVGLAFALVQEKGGGEPLERGGRVSWRALDSSALHARLPYPILDVVILQSPDSALPAFPRRVQPRPLDDGPHLSYMLQWFGFAVIFAVGGITVALGRRAPGWSEPTAPVPSAAEPPRPPPA